MAYGFSIEKDDSGDRGFLHLFHGIVAMRIASDEPPTG